MNEESPAFRRGEQVKEMAQQEMDRLCGMNKRLRAALAETRAAGDALAHQATELTIYLQGVPNVGSSRSRLSAWIEQWRSVRGDTPSFGATATVSVPPKPTQSAGPADDTAPESRDERVDRLTAAVEAVCDAAAIDVEVYELNPGLGGWQRSGKTSPLRRLVRALEGAGLLDPAGLDDAPDTGPALEAPDA